MAFIALLDANVLWPVSLRDTLLRAHLARLYRAAWSRDILEEVERTLKRRYPHLDAASFERLHRVLLDKFPEALVENYDDLIPVMRNEVGDRHVLAAAVRGRADVLVTFNVRDFPREACHPYAIDVQTPDRFLSHLWHLDPERMADVLVEQAAALHKKPMTPDELVTSLERQVPEFAAVVRTSGLLAQYRL
jgi:predicted nucleic acid-binding protein